MTGDNSPVVVEEYMFETERSQGRVNIARLVIMQRLSDECFLGSLYVDRDFKDADFKGSTCRYISTMLSACRIIEIMGLSTAHLQVLEISRLIV